MLYWTIQFFSVKFVSCKCIKNNFQKSLSVFCFFGTPTVNGLILSKIICIIVEATNNMFYSSKLLIIFWVEMVHTTTHVLNRIRTVTLFYKTNLMKLGLLSKPMLFTLEFLGMLHLHISLKRYVISFLPKVKSVSFISYNDHCKAYCLWDLEAHKLLLAKMLFFD
jgi:hypothetical protein